MTPPPPPPPLNLATPRLSITYTVTRSDMLCWHFYVLCRNRILIVLVTAVSLFVAWRDLQMPEMAKFSLAPKILYALFITALMFGFVGCATMATMWLSTRFKKLKGVLGEHTLEIRDDGLAERTAVNESLIRWAGIHKLVHTRRHLIIYVTETNAYLVPRKYFASPQDENQFRAEIEKRIQSA
ncbi:MAG TPA: YcxB family protein [Candidatus Acidoferrales bacterium]|nr:YcxB family protein [Candidatus Acidoferrales bacterium]